MDAPADNNQYEVKPSTKSKRKTIFTPCDNAYLNPGLDILVNEDPMCNTAMEIIPNRKRKRTRSCDGATFENTALDLGISKAAANEYLIKELNNVRRNIKADADQAIKRPEESLTADVPVNIPKESILNDPIYTNVTDTTLPLINEVDPRPFTEQSFTTMSNNNNVDTGFVSELPGSKQNISSSCIQQSEIGVSSRSNTSIENNVTNQIFINNTSNLSLSFIDRLALESPNVSNQSLYLDDDLNESNIMEIKTITIITQKKRISDKLRNTNPFLDPTADTLNVPASQNPFLDADETNSESEYNVEIIKRPVMNQINQENNLVPRRLFDSDTNSTISTMNESLTIEQHEYENLDTYRTESPIYENIGEDIFEEFNKQSKILGFNVSKLTAADINNMNDTSSTNESYQSKKDLKHTILRASNKLSKKVLKKLKKTFKSDKPEHNNTMNPYEVPRKVHKQKPALKDNGIENPGLNLDNSDDIEIEEIGHDEEHHYETVKTLRNTRLNMNVTPLKGRGHDDAGDAAHATHSRADTPGKKVRFDCTLNQEKLITGNSFDCGVQSPGFEAKIDKFHDELENCINERKFIQQNM